MLTYHLSFHLSGLFKKWCPELEFWILFNGLWNIKCYDGAFWSAFAQMAAIGKTSWIIQGKLIKGIQFFIFIFILQYFKLHSEQRCHLFSFPLQYSKHLFVHIGQTNPSYSDPLLEAVDIRQIYDKFPEKKGGLKELYERGPQNSFFLVKFWVRTSCRLKLSGVSDC